MLSHEVNLKSHLHSQEIEIKKQAMVCTLREMGIMIIYGNFSKLLMSTIH